MASNTTQFFRNSNQVFTIRFAVLTTAGGDELFSADATNLRDLTKLLVVNTTGAAITLTVYEADATTSDIIKVISIPANSGQALNIDAIKLIADINNQLPGVRLDAFGNYFLRIAANKKLKVAASATGLRIIGEIESFQL